MKKGLSRLSTLLLLFLSLSFLIAFPCFAEEKNYNPYRISSPGSIEGLLKLNQGLQFSVSVLNDDHYHEYIDNYGLITVPERGLIYYRVIENSNWVSDLALYYNTNREMRVSEPSPYTSNIYCVEGGITYYANIYYCNGGEGINYKHYLYYLPASECITAGQTLSSDKTYSVLSLNSPEQAHVSYRYVEGNCDWDDRDYKNWIDIEGSSLKVNKNGTYTILAEWDGYAENGWDDFYMLRTIDVTGIVPKSEFKITFDANGGKLPNQSDKTKVVTNGKTYGTLPEPAKSGKVFSGWFTKKSGGSQINGTTTVNLNADTVLYAHWKKPEKNKLTINFIDDEVKRSYKASYSDAYFFKSATSLQKDLALLSALGAASTYQKKGDSKNYAKDMMKKCGFTADGGFLFSKNGKSGKSKKTDNDHARVQFGYRKIDDETLVVAIFINGYTSGGYEWRSNFNLGTGKQHTGFYTAEAEIKKLLDSRISKYKNKFGRKINMKFWITGHSRAAAITNILGIELSDKYGKDNVYAFGFATPMYSKKSTAYPNIRNYIIQGDFVPKVAPVKWGFTRNNKSKDIILKDDSKMKSIYKTIIGKKYNGFSSKESNQLLNAFLAFSGSQQKFIEFRWYSNKNGGTAQDFCQEGMANAVTGQLKTGISVMSYFAANDKNAAKVFGLLILNGTDLNPKFKDAHRMAAYVAGVAAKYN